MENLINWSTSLECATCDGKYCILKGHNTNNSSQSSEESPYSLVYHNHIKGILPLIHVMHLTPQQGQKRLHTSATSCHFVATVSIPSVQFFTHAMIIRPRKLVTLRRWNVNISRMDLVGSQIFPIASSCYCVEEFEEYNHYTQWPRTYM